MQWVTGRQMLIAEQFANDPSAVLDPVDRVWLLEIRGPGAANSTPPAIASGYAKLLKTRGHPPEMV